VVRRPILRTGWVRHGARHAQTPAVHRHCRSTGPGPHAANLNHHYDFSTGVVDLAGTINGTLFGIANLAGGTLNLDSSGDWAEFPVPIMPNAGSYSRVQQRWMLCRRWGWAPGAGVQAQASNRHELLGSRVLVVSVDGKGAAKTVSGEIRGVERK
jgi:hypothetical protein